MLTEADRYFTEYHFGEEIWFVHTERNRLIALRQAESQLQPYQQRADKKRFPLAVYEQALWLLKGLNDPRAELQRAGVVSYRIGDLSESFDTGNRPAGISPDAWGYLDTHRKIRLGRLK